MEIKLTDGKGGLIMGEELLDVGAGYVKMWDQTVINEGRLRYIQSEPNKTHDAMEFDVTNGVQTLRDLRLDFIVVPTILLLASQPIIVNEGKSLILMDFRGALSPQLFPVISMSCCCCCSV